LSVFPESAFERFSARHLRHPGEGRDPSCFAACHCSAAIKIKNGFRLSPE
jgi:hypothetical protein